RPAPRRTAGFENPAGGRLGPTMAAVYRLIREREPPMTIAVTFLEQGKQTPTQVAAQLAEFLEAARTSLHLALYDFRLGDAVAAPVVEALRRRAAAGVEVRLAYDAGKPHAS